MPDTTESRSKTRSRLLEAATAVFAKHGFRDAGIREICRRAGTNQAAVNYHFGSKQALYSAVLRAAFERAGPEWPMPRLEDAPDRPEEQLEKWIRWFVERMFQETVMSQLMFSELREKTPALDQLIDESIRPVFVEVAGMISALTGEPPGGRKVELLCSSVLGQCIFYKTAKPLIERLHRFHRRSDDEIERIAEHVFRFSMAGIRELTNPAARSQDPHESEPPVDPGKAKS